jgi:hypothetical protein
LIIPTAFKQMAVDYVLPKVAWIRCRAGSRDFQERKSNGRRYLLLLYQQHIQPPSRLHNLLASDAFHIYPLRRDAGL